MSDLGPTLLCLPGLGSPVGKLLQGPPCIGSALAQGIMQSAGSLVVEGPDDAIWPSPTTQQPQFKKGCVGVCSGHALRLK